MSLHTGCDAIDVHTHVVPEHFPPYAKKAAEVAWPSMVPAHDCHRHVMLSGKIYRTVSDRCWDVQARIADMTPLGISSQVLSPMPELLSYWLDAEDGAALSRYINEQIAEMVGREPGRFHGLGAVPLQDVDRAVAELVFLTDELGLSGVEIGTNINGIVLGDARLEPFFAAAEELGAAIFVHPLRPVGKERLIGPKALEQVLAFPGETALAAASLLTAGTLARHPNLRIAFSHGGGSLAMLLPRLQHGWETFDELRKVMPVSPNTAARRMYYDSLVYDTATLMQLIGRFGQTQILVGSDFPFRIRERDPVGRINALPVEAGLKAQLLRHNAMRWLGIAQ
ncbi:MAG: amidohydrolase family protein [Aquisalimonadaceae bacterium]